MEWLPYRQSFSDELHRLDGRCGYTSDNCSECDAPDSHYRCRDCLDFALYCDTCLIKRHSTLPLHRIEVVLYLIYMFYPDLTDSHTFSAGASAFASSSNRLFQP